MRETVDIQGFQEKDLNLQVIPGVSLALDFLDWDTRFFKRPVYLLNVEASQLNGDAVKDVRPLREQLPRFAMWAKVPIHVDQRILMLLQELGGYFVETEILLQYEPGVLKELPSSPSFSFRKNSSLPREAMGLLGLNFETTRFHVDPNIGEDLADRLWESYMATYGDKPGRNFYLAYTQEEKPVGAVFISDATEKRPYHLLDIAVVDKSCHGARVGSGLIQRALQDYQDRRRPLIVSTQHRNSSAVCFYIKNGFKKYLPPTTVFHFWNG